MLLTHELVSFVCNGMQHGIEADLNPFQNLLDVAESLLQHPFHFGKPPPGVRGWQQQALNLEYQPLERFEG